MRILTYSDQKQAYMPGTAPTYYANTIGSVTTINRVGGSPGFNMHFSCVTHFEVKDRKIVHWRWEGNNCRARDN